MSQVFGTSLDKARDVRSLFLLKTLLKPQLC